MFRTRWTEKLLFSFSRPGRYAITAWFVFFPFLAVFTDSNFRVTEVRYVKPFVLTTRPAKPYSHLIEIPVNEENRTFLRFFVGKRETFKYLRR